MRNGDCVCFACFGTFDLLYDMPLIVLVGGVNFTVVSSMLKACKYCGQIHPREYVCPKKPKSLYIGDKKIRAFRNSKAWDIKRKEIRDRDNNLCVACWHNLKGTLNRITTSGLSVHHIVPLYKAWALRLDDDNLITLCSTHHELAEKGEISKETLRECVKKGVNISPPHHKCGEK